MQRVTYEELRKAFDEVCDSVSSMPCGFEDFAGEFAAEIKDRLYEQDIDDQKRPQHHCGVSGWRPDLGDAPCPACAPLFERGKKQ